MNNGCILSNSAWKMTGTQKKERITSDADENGLQFEQLESRNGSFLRKSGCSWEAELTIWWRIDSNIGFIPKRGAGMAQWWEHSPPNNVAPVQFPDSASHVGWVCCWFSSLVRVLRFFPFLKNQYFQILIRSGLLSNTLSWGSGLGDCTSTSLCYWH